MHNVKHDVSSPILWAIFALFLPLPLTTLLYFIHCSHWLDILDTVTIAEVVEELLEEVAFQVDVNLGVAN